MTTNQQTRIAKNAKTVIEGMAYGLFESFVAFMADKSDDWKAYGKSLKADKDEREEQGGDE